MDPAFILRHIPQQHPFRFVDHIEEISEDHVKGSYFFAEDLAFYTGHFPENPITPGVILTECMAQIGLVSLGIYLMRDKPEMASHLLVLADSQVQFLHPVYPQTRVTVEAKKQYFRLKKLKCDVKLFDESGQCCAKGTLSGVVVPPQKAPSHE